jgi:glycosyltransferase involved in cell wall biosynthesis
VVVDNCPDATARNLVEAIARPASVGLRYIHEPLTGISNARNAGLTQAKTGPVAFIDDDEVARENWLSSLLATQARYSADVVFGPVLACTDESNRPEWEAIANILSLSSDCPTGTPVGSSLLTPFWARGSKAYPALASGNFLLCRRFEKLAAVRFDARLGRTGGEDTVYFNQLLTLGAHMVWCAEATVWEHVSSERQKLSYIVRRAFRGGQITSRAPILLTPPQPALTLLSMGIGITQAPIWLALAAGWSLVGSRGRYYYTAQLASALGKLFWGAPFRARPYGQTGRAPDGSTTRV